MERDLLNILGVEYQHIKTADGGDLYLTVHGIKVKELLSLENWYDDDWFSEHSERLLGTSAVYRVPTKEVDGTSIQLVVKNCRVGEDVPVDTHTLEKFVNAEFNSPWEEFALVTELRESPAVGNKKQIFTQHPLAIYVPPDRLQLWQTGRSRTKINKINRRHPGVDLDILKQYKLIYQWIDGLDIVQAFESLGYRGSELNKLLSPITQQVLADLEAQGFAVADMKAVHIIIPEEHIKAMQEAATSAGREVALSYIQKYVIDTASYAIVDYELLIRTVQHEQEVMYARRHSYLDVLRDRFVFAPLPSHLVRTEIFGMPYVHGRVESTGGLLWVLGRNALLYDYFLPERWRKTPVTALSEKSEIYRTITKDNIYIVWKTSRVGEEGSVSFNSPFEEFSIANKLVEAGVPCVYVRAIYMTGSTKIEAVSDESRYLSHKDFLAIDGEPILRENHNYITIRGYYNGPDAWVAEQKGALYEPIDLYNAVKQGVVTSIKADKIMENLKEHSWAAGFDASALKLNDVILSKRPDGILALDPEGQPEARITNFETIVIR